MVIDQKKQRFLEQDIEGKFLYNEPLSLHTSLRIGGAASLYIEPKDRGALEKLLARTGKMDTPPLILGGGSNILFRDSGMKGIVISTKGLDRLYMISENDETMSFFIESGAPLQKLITLSRKYGLRGTEGLAGIPGTFGGALSGNAGAFGYEIKDCIETVSVMDSNGILSTLRGEKIKFGYRESDIGERTVITGASIRLRRGDLTEVTEKMKAFLEEKKRSQPLGECSAGCVFKNPEGGYAGKLIEMSGCKGMGEGGIVVSPVHANFFVNSGEGTCDAYLSLMEKVAMKVEKEHGISLEPEIRIY